MHQREIQLRALIANLKECLQACEQELADINKFKGPSKRILSQRERFLEAYRQIKYNTK